MIPGMKGGSLADAATGYLLNIGTKIPPTRSCRVLFYILDDAGNPVAEPDPIKWATFFRDREKYVLKRDSLPGDVSVITIFTGIDYRSRYGIFEDESSPILWETVIFGGPHDRYQNGYTSREDALAGHEAALQLAGAGP